MYADANCMNATTTSTVEQTMLSASAAGTCIDNDKKFFVVNAKPVFSTLTIYEDSTCSGTPSHIIFSRDFACQQVSDPKNASCKAFGNSLFSVSGCTKDYNEFTATAFGVNNPFVIERASLSWACSDDSVTAYSADGICHVNSVDNSSFRARIDSQGTLAFYKFYDAGCTNNRDPSYVYSSDLVYGSCMVYECSFLPSLCSRQECNNLSSCRRKLSVGGPSGTPPSGKFTTVAVFEDSSCSSPPISMSLTNELSCTPQVDHFDPVCLEQGAMFSVSDCTQYYAGGWDDLGLINDVFGDYPRLIVEQYAWCGFMDKITGVTVYRLDELCHTNSEGNGSYRLTLDRSITITTFTDTNCLNTATVTDVDRSTISSGPCGPGDKKFIISNAPSAFTVVATFEDSKCSGAPSQISFIPAFGCHGAQDFADAPCESAGNSLFTVSSCTNDYNKFSMVAFGIGNPFVVEHGYLILDCSSVGLITTYSPDGICHTKPNSNRSFRVSIDSVGTLVFKTFYDSMCQNEQHTRVLDKYQLSLTMCMADNCDLMPSLCAYGNCPWWMCGRKLSIGGLDPVHSFNSAVIVFKDSSCSGIPIQIVIKKQLTCSEPRTCNAVTTTQTPMYQNTECIEDVTAFSKSQFDGVPYLIMEKYKDGSNCEKQKGIVVYKADGLCYDSAADGTSFRVLPSFGGSITFVSYLTTSCDDNEAEVIAIGSKYINTGACYAGNMKLYGNLTALSSPASPSTCPTPTTTTPTPTPTTSTPTPPSSVDFNQKTREEIMFPTWLWEPTPRRIFEIA